ncbi:DNA polymerase III subunit gamma/tau [Noviherbaspirillum pedocola]|uniref:DNA polymerase III subunit gamma/tau n=1 Tax=Noviherbaspirillum pedocola TaxID=2801341 RepID=A0A934SQE5_9BURK|nr:DNA polymerase III subunit gamma/tau [Noviherbaspirillum pedocola]MBK4733582.1 DNA polymerase III subunit gamma/tau [Noviherbaspirillum pedocola]
MSYQVLARKYRPRSFESLVGQEHVVRALTHALEQKRLHHAYLFTGTRGVGKTTLSRILAKCLNCIGPDGQGDITAHPCGVCEACVAIDAGRFVDYIEMDAASNRGVDDMAQLLEQAVYAPSNARFKVYMIDEVHMLSNQAFNAMLKTLEEPPGHVKFILATTDPQKIPVTVLSRCLQFNLKQMPPGHIVGHLENILGQEEIPFETPALRLLAQGAHGSMRDALSLTDQAIAYAAGKVTLDAVQTMLGALDQSFLVRLLDALAADDGAGLLAVADDMAARSLSYDAALQDLASLLHRIALAQLAPAALPEDAPEREHILRLAGVLDADEVQLYYQIAVHGRNELALAPDDYAGFTMTLLRMLAFRPGNAPAEAAPAPSPAREAPVARAAAQPRTAPAASAAAPVAPASAPTPAASAAPAGRPAAGTMSPARAALEAARGLKRGAGASSAAEAAPAAFVAAVPPPKKAPASEPPPWDDLPPFDDFEPAQKKTEPPAVAARPTVEAMPVAAVTVSIEPEAPVASAVVEAPPQRPVPELGWDGDWPQLAAMLPVRGVAHQLAQQSELLECAPEGNTYVFRLRVPVDTLCSAISIEKLTAALAERFGKPVRLQHEIGPVQRTANAKAEAARAQRQREAEQTMHSDPFLQTLMREFGATIVPGSIKPV